MDFEVACAPDELHDKLQRFYRIVKDQLINYQHPFSGLFPCKPGPPQGCVCHVRDSVYCATAVWALHRCFQRLGDESGQSFELRQSAIKCMRAILQAWMQQTVRLEQFKTAQNLETCLSTRLDYATGQPIEGKDYNHLQMDCVGLYVLQLAQMILSGLQIIHTKTEAAFVQNLIFYLERAYRIPDYGMWERGSKQNRNITELHASSIGMAKAAMESLSGFNLFGVEGDHSTVIFTEGDAHSRNSMILDTLLPRESASKGTDAALIPTLCWPAFAIHTPEIHKITMKRVDVLKGNYGYKRFTRDGYATVLETCTIYTQGELSKFRGIENEWPMFFAYQIIACYFAKDYEKAQMFEDLLEPLLVTPVSEKYPWLPKYYFVPEDSLDEERETPGKAIRKSNFKLQAEPRFLWGQSVFIVSQLMSSGLLQIHDLDPLGRHCPANSRPLSLVSRYSTISSRPATMLVQVVLIAESTRLQQILATYGIRTQTPVEIEPLKLWPPHLIVRACLFMGLSKRLRLNGRPPRPLGPIGTSKFYRICGSTVLVFPHLFENQSFYFSYDMRAVIEEVKNDLVFLSKCWRMKGRPTYCFLVKEDMILGPGRDQLIRFLVSLQNTYVDGVRIVLGRAQNLVATGCTDYLDFFPDWASRLDEFNGLQQLQAGRSYRSLTDLPKALQWDEAGDNERECILPATLAMAITDAADKKHFSKMPDADLASFIFEPEVREKFAPPVFSKGDPVLETAFAKTAIDMAHEVAVLHELMTRYSLDYVIRQNEPLSTVREFLTNLLRRAGLHQVWTVVRLCAALLGRYVNSLAPSTSSILVCGKQLTMGAVQGPEVGVNKPMNPNQLYALLREAVFSVDPIQISLQQELILVISALLNKDTSLFKGIAVIRLGWFLEAMKLQLEAEEVPRGKNFSPPPGGDDPEQNLTSTRSLGACRLHSLAPSYLKGLLHRTLHLSLCDVENTSIRHRHSSRLSEDGREQTSKENALFQRQLDGCLGRVPAAFYESVYHILEKAPRGILIMSNMLPQNPTLLDMTPHDLNLVFQVECMMRSIADPAYRALFVETVMVIAVILERNEELSFTEVVDFRVVIENAIKDFAVTNRLAASPSSGNNNDPEPGKKGTRTRRLSWPKNDIADDWSIYQKFASTPANIRLGTTSFLAKAAVSLLLHGSINLRDVSKETCCLS
uniref:Phosphorylase b kinase regulatory subunit n=1 Tax=Schistocephalus solidus TaxID=70667 RepID=A0A0X3PN91_SCHSO